MGGRFDGVRRIDLDLIDSDILVLFDEFSDSGDWSAVLMLRYMDTRTRFRTALYPSMTRGLCMTSWDNGPSVCSGQIHVMLVPLMFTLK